MEDNNRKNEIDSLENITRIYFNGVSYVTHRDKLPFVKLVYQIMNDRQITKKEAIEFLVDNFGKL